MEIFKKYYFDSAHYLPNVPENHKCRNMHGHTYKLIVFVKGDTDIDKGWVMDFAELKNAINPIIEIVDHKILNDISGLENPTCENIAKWLWIKIKEKIPALIRIELHETPTTGVIYQGE
ncbi:MAG: 6-carboxytetrahydropterin synthase QueD [Bacteroidia bacterium]